MIYAVLAVLVLFILGRLLASQPDVSEAELDELLKNGGKLVDVRTVSEFRSGHAGGSVNLPLETLPGGMKNLDVSPDTPILLCCASGIRSSQAKKVLQKAGFTLVFNAGSISSLRR